jgi:hypothetical protein
MTKASKPSAQERGRYEAAVDNFMNLLARLLAREHLRQSAEADREKSDSNNKDNQRGKCRNQKARKQRDE